MFNINNEIAIWVKSLRKNSSLEDAVKKIGKIENAGTEFYKSDVKYINKRSPWETPTWTTEMKYNT